MPSVLPGQSGFVKYVIAKILGFVASGPFGDAMLSGGVSAMVLGVTVHFFLMAIIVAIYAVTAGSSTMVARSPWLAGTIFGFGVWVVMYWIVRPLRWPAMPLPHTLLSISEQLFSHILLVGIPVALTVSRRGGVDPIDVGRTQ